MAWTFTERLRWVIGETPFTRWATDHGFTPSTVEEWVNKNRTPRDASLEKLVLATGIPAEWWLHGDGPPQKAHSDRVMRDIPAFSRGESSSRRVDEERAGYVAVPLYNGVRAAAGAGAVANREMPDDALIFKEDWIRFELGARPNDLYLIRVAGDSMEPTLRAGDTILVDRRAIRPDREGIYILRMNDMLLVKRLQSLPGGIVKVASDNQAFAAFEVKLADIEDGELTIIGRVVWAGRRL